MSNLSNLSNESNYKIFPIHHKITKKQPNYEELYTHTNPYLIKGNSITQRNNSQRKFRSNANNRRSRSKQKANSNQRANANQASEVSYNNNNRNPIPESVLLTSASNYLSKLNRTTEYSLTPNRSDSSEVKLDENTIVLYINTHGSLEDGKNCVRLNVFNDIEIFQKVYMGQRGCVNYSSFTLPSGIHKLFDELAKKRNKKIDFLRLCRSTYKQERNSTKRRLRVILDNSLSREELLNNKVKSLKTKVGHDHHQSYFYNRDDQIGKQTVLIDKLFTTNKVDINKSLNYSISPFVSEHALFPGILVLYDGMKPNQTKIDYLYKSAQSKHIPRRIYLSDIISDLESDGYKKILIYDRSCNVIDGDNTSNQTCLPPGSMNF